ncbi:MAG: hypothetical protein KF780_11770 [Sphingomonas sp.]|nr:hypothetical protein [Sphingomonas sp.]
MRTTLPCLALAGLAALGLAAPAAAQDRDRPLGDLLDALPDDGAEAPEKPEPAAAAPERPFAPLLRPPPPRARPAPAPVPGRIGTTELPPSAALYPENDPSPAPPAGLSGDALGAPVAIDPPPPPTEADLAWQALQEQRRREINAVEAPLVARLNAQVAADQEAARLRAEQDRADYERALLDRDAEAARIEADHRAAIEAHRRAVARQRAAHEARVAACLAGDRAACAPR